MKFCVSCGQKLEDDNRFCPVCGTESKVENTAMQTEVPTDEQEGALVGFVLFGITDDGDAPFGVIFDLGVEPACRGQRVGQQLMERALAFFREQSVRDCYLESGINNHSAHEFFEHHGFRAVSSVFRLKL